MSEPTEQDAARVRCAPSHDGHPCGVCETAVPPTQPPDAPETDANALVEVLRDHLARDRYDEEGESLGTYCTCGGWSGDYFADGEPGPFELHLAEVIERIVAERVRVVEGERDAARSEHNESCATTDQFRDQKARAESAEAAHRALQAERDALRAGIWALGESIHGDEGVEHVEGCEGEPTCFACILADLRALAGGAR